MNLIVGYGYCGSYLAEELAKNGESVTAWSRGDIDVLPDNIKHCRVDVTDQGNEVIEKYDTIFYLIPSPSEQREDTTLSCFLAKLNVMPKTLVYFGSSGVYGNQHGHWATEESALNAQGERAQRRINAEQQLQHFCQKNDINLVLLRVAGIYGPNRIPLQKVLDDKPIIQQADAPFINLIYVEDLVRAAIQLAVNQQGIDSYNVSDGKPVTMGYSQIVLAELLKRNPPKQIALDTFTQKASPMLLEFLQSSKKLSNKKLRSALPENFRLHDLRQALMKIIRISGIVE